MAPLAARADAATERRLPPYAERALVLWPGLDRSRLRRTRGDPIRIARLVARRTALSLDEIVELLTQPSRR